MGTSFAPPPGWAETGGPMSAAAEAPDGADETLLLQAAVGGHERMRTYSLDSGETASVSATVALDRDYLEATGAGALLVTFISASVDPTG